jgi:predicted lipoprotein with Yx(FWY)xxD motif
MRKSGWAAAAALGSLALLLAGCGGSSSSAGSSGTTPTAGARPTSEIGITPGDTVLIVQKSKLGYVLALANGDVVYTYGADKKGGQPTCTNSCAAIWPGVTGIPMTNSGETLPAGTLGTVTLANGAKQITYDGLPLYYLKSEKPLATTGNGMDGGMWRVIKLSSADITGG